MRNLVYSANSSINCRFHTTNLKNHADFGKRKTFSGNINLKLKSAFSKTLHWTNKKAPVITEAFSMIDKNLL